MPKQPQRPAQPGKPTIGPENHDEKVGQRDQTGAPHDAGEKPAIGPNKHDNDGQRGTVVADDNDVE